MGIGRLETKGVEWGAAVDRDNRRPVLDMFSLRSYSKKNFKWKSNYMNLILGNRSKLKL